MKNRIVFIFLCACLCSCMQHKGTEQGTAKVIKVEQAKKADWSKMIVVDSIIPLEQTEASLLSIAQKCLINKDRIFFHDYRQKQVFAFDRQGHFLFTVGRRGGAADEYVEFE